MKKKDSIVFMVTILVLLLGLACVSSADTPADDATINTVASTPSTTQGISTPLKNVKTEETSTDFYVSDTSGSDSNSGTNDSPFKTIQTALDKTSSDSTYNIHIADGTYKGLGNTNLTVNGNYNINIIGDSSTIIDGEAKYDMKTELLPGEYYWDSSPEWYPFQNASGNWAMNITSGSGTITLRNLTIQNCYSQGVDGGDSISKYPIATVDNYASLVVDNVKFIDNCAGVGGAIRNNHEATLTVENSSFTGNRKSTSSGNDGGAIYNNGTATINGSVFTDNYSRWGTILNDAKLTITNSTISNNHAYDGTSTYKYGAGIASDSGKADFFNPYSITGIETIIDGCVFEDNGQTDVWMGDGILIVKNSVINNSTGIYINTNQTDSFENITNNTISTKTSTLFTSLSVLTGSSFGVKVFNKSNIIIADNNITTDGGYAIDVINNTSILNNTLKSPVNIAGSNNMLKYNTINTTSIYAISIANRTNNNFVQENILESSMLYGNNAVNSTTAVVEDNLPNIGQNITITDDTYNQYFYENGSIIPGAIEVGSIVTLSGDFYNKSFIVDDLKLTVKATGTIYNGTITVKSDGRINAESVRINNVNTTDEYALLLESDANILSGVNIDIDTVNPVHAIIIRGDHNELSATVTVYAPSNPVTRSDNLADSMVLDIQSSNNVISNSQLHLYSNSNTTDGMLVGISIESVDKPAENNTLYQVGSSVSYGEYVHSIRIINSSNNVLNRQQSSFRWDTRAEYATKEAIGIYIAGKSDNNRILQTNNMYTSKYNGRTDYNAYSIVVNGSNTKINNTYIKNTASAQLLIVNATNTQINNNTASTSIGNFTAIMIVDCENTLINKTTINVPKKNVTAILVQDSVNTGIYNSTIKADQIIILNNSNTSTVADNDLNINDTMGGDETVTIINSTESLVENNTPVILRLTDDNYGNYFDENSVYNATNTFILLSSNLYNKDITIPVQVTFLNPENYTVYNGTLSLIENARGSNITGLNFYSNDERATIIYSDVSYTYLHYLNIYQENHENPVRTIVYENKGYNRASYANIKVLGPEIKTDDNTPSTVVIVHGSGAQNLLSVSNITIESTKTDNEGYISFVTTRPSVTGILTISQDNINITGKNVIALDDDLQNSERINLTINADNTATLLKSENATTMILRNNKYNITSNNTATVYNISNPDTFATTLTNITMNINSPNILLANIINSTRSTANIVGNLTLTTQNITLLQTKNSLTGLIVNITNLEAENLTIVDADNSTVTIQSSSINASITNNNGIIITNNSNAIFYNYLNGNMININTTNPTPMITITDSTADIQKCNITQNTTNTPLIKSTNSQITVTNNYLQTLDLAGDDTVEITGGQATVKDNQPSQTGYKTQITSIETPETIIVKTNNPITVNITDIFGEEITGTITITDAETTTTSNTNTIDYTPQTTGQKTLTITYTDPTGKYDTTTKTLTITVELPTLTIEPITATIGETTSITAKLVGQVETLTDINTGRVYFKVDGKVLRDTTTNKVIYVDVTEGVATLTDYTVPETWNDDTQIKAVYTSNDMPTITSQAVNPTITGQEQPEFSVSDVTTTAGSEVTITVTTKNLDSGKVVLKVNGKTVKASDGKLYAKVEGDTVTFTYTVPKTLKTGEYSIKAVYTSGTIKLEDEAVLTVNL